MKKKKKYEEDDKGVSKLGVRIETLGDSNEAGK